MEKVEALIHTAQIVWMYWKSEVSEKKETMHMHVRVGVFMGWAGLASLSEAYPGPYVAQAQHRP